MTIPNRISEAIRTYSTTIEDHTLKGDVSSASMMLAACMALEQAIAEVVAERDAARAEVERLAKQRDELVRMATKWAEQVPDESLFASGNFDDCRDYGMAQAEVWCGEAILKAIATEPTNPVLSFNGVPIHLENSFLDGEQSPQEIWPAFPEQPKPQGGAS